MAKPVTEKLAATVAAIAWEIYDNDTIDDAFEVPWLWLNLATPPSSAGLVYLYIISPEGAAFKALIGQANPVGRATVSFEDVSRIEPGYKLQLEYANPDGVSCTGEAYVRRARYIK